MSSYVQAIRTALVLFPFVALLFTIPYMMVQYRRYGAILLLRTAIIYSFILYIICTYFLTMLPLPEIEAVRQLTTQRYRLVPFYDFGEMFFNSAVHYDQPATWYKLFWSSGMFQIVANVVMTMPFGVYLRYYFGFNLKKTVLCSLLWSLSFELIQLSGLFFIYPRPYRLFEVDDLITNTLGGVLGYLCAPLVMKVLPSRERMDEVAYRRGDNASVTRRAFAAMLDFILLILGFIALVVMIPAMQPHDAQEPLALVLWMLSWYAIGIAGYFILGEWLTGGRSIGKTLLRLKLTDKRTGGRPKLWQCAVRYATLYYVVLPAPLTVLCLILFSDGQDVALWVILVSAALIAIYILFWLLLIVNVFTHSIQTLHDKLSLTINQNTLPFKQRLQKYRRKREDASAS